MNNKTLLIVAGVIALGGLLYYRYVQTHQAGATVVYQHGGLTVTGVL